MSDVIQAMLMGTAAGLALGLAFSIYIHRQGEEK
jgi:hypothetical protein